MDSDVLSPLGLFNLTGYRQQCKQIAWFKRELNLDVPVGADGYPRVSQAVIDKATLTRGQATAGASARPGAAPRWSKSVAA